MKLLHSHTSPYARKVRVVAAEKKLELELVESDPWLPNPTLVRLNPLGKVPALLLDDDTSLFDSRVIVEYLDGLSPVHRLIPENSRERIAVKRWEAIADGLCDAAILARLENARPDKNDSSHKQIARQRGKISDCLDEMERELGEREFCVGNVLTLADVAVACALGYLKLRFPDINWEATHHALARHYRKHATRPSLRATEPV